jgi:hypothetical protein
MSNPTIDYIADNLEIAVENYVVAMTDAVYQQGGIDGVMSLLEYRDTDELTAFINKWINKGK